MKSDHTLCLHRGYNICTDASMSGKKMFAKPAHCLLGHTPAVKCQTRSRISHADILPVCTTMLSTAASKTWDPAFTMSCRNS